MAQHPSTACRVPLADGADVVADVAVPPGAVAVVVFAHGSGSSRLSPRNRSVARSFNDRGLATVLVDLLTPEEDQRDRVTAQHRFDIDLLGRRVVETVDWVAGGERTAGLPIGTFGASTGAAAALVAAAARPGVVGAVVSRGGRPDLAGDTLARVAVPTLLIVGGADLQVLELNRRAAARLGGPVSLEVVAGAGHLFEEPGAMRQVEGLAAEWLVRHLSTSPPSPPTQPDSQAPQE